MVSADQGCKQIAGLVHDELDALAAFVAGLAAALSTRPPALPARVASLARPCS
jgi:hypothetical protein